MNRQICFLQKQKRWTKTLFQAVKDIFDDRIYFQEVECWKLQDHAKEPFCKSSSE